METYYEAKECDAPTLETEQEAYNKDQEVKLEADHLSEEEEEESSDLAQLFSFTGDAIKRPGISCKKMTHEKKRTHNK